MKKYIVAFHLNGSLSIYTTNKGLLQSEITNFKLVLLQYVITAVVLSFLFKKGYQTVEVAINRKIVI
jgi:hypothetical protein